jgi:hypothetical protein
MSNVYCGPLLGRSKISFETFWCSFLNAWFRKPQLLFCYKQLLFNLSFLKIHWI